MRNSVYHFCNLSRSLFASKGNVNITEFVLTGGLGDFIIWLSFFKDASKYLESVITVYVPPSNYSVLSYFSNSKLIVKPLNDHDLSGVISLSPQTVLVGSNRFSTYLARRYFIRALFRLFGVHLYNQYDVIRSFTSFFLSLNYVNIIKNSKAVCLAPDSSLRSKEFDVNRISYALEDRFGILRHDISVISRDTSCGFRNYFTNNLETYLQTTDVLFLCSDSFLAHYLSSNGKKVICIVNNTLFKNFCGSFPILYFHSIVEN